MSLSARRAWIEIICTALKKYPVILSLSARRAWIEISGGVSARPLVAVALRKESVDRNDNGNPVAVSDLESLSARRAWIEISTQCKL